MYEQAPSGAWLLRALACDSFYFRLYLAEQIGGKEIHNCDPQAVAQLLNGGHRRAVVPAADNVVYGGLGNTADGTQLID